MDIEGYLNRIEEMIDDENKTVTYKSLSRTLGIHTNTAKQLLHSYLSNQNAQSKVPIIAIYLLAGVLKDGSFNITLANEADLKSTCSKYANVTSKHIYSLQKTKSEKSLKHSFNIDSKTYDVKSPGILIKCLKAVKKVKNETKPLKNVCLAEENKKSNLAVAAEDKSSENNAVPFTSQNSTSGNKKVSKSPKNANSGDGESKVKAKEEHKNEKENKKNIAHFFKQAAEKSNAKKIDKTLKTEQHQSNNSPEEIIKRKKTKKRKRIQVSSDSDASNSDNEQTSLAEEENTPQTSIFENKEEEEEIFKEKPHNKRKKKKIIDRVVENENGYIETKKEIVFETDSENESSESVNAPQKDSCKSLKTKSADGNERSKVQGLNTVKKQSSLLAFLKKN